MINSCALTYGYDKNHLWSVYLAALVFTVFWTGRLAYAIPMSSTTKAIFNQEFSGITCPEHWIPIESQSIAKYNTCYRILSLNGPNSNWIQHQANCQKTLDQLSPSDRRWNVDLLGLDAAEAYGNWEARWFRAQLEDKLDFHADDTARPLYIPVSLRSRASAAPQMKPSEHSKNISYQYPSNMSASGREWEWRWTNGTGALQPLPELDVLTGRLIYRTRMPAFRWHSGFPHGDPSTAGCAFWVRSSDPDSSFSPRWGLVNVHCSLLLPAPPLIVCKLTRTLTDFKRTHTSSPFGKTTSPTGLEHTDTRTSNIEPPIVSRKRTTIIFKGGQLQTTSYSRSSTTVSFETATNTKTSDWNVASPRPGHVTRRLPKRSSSSAAEDVGLVVLLLALGVLIVANLGALMCCIQRRCRCVVAEEKQEGPRKRSETWPQLPDHLRPRHYRRQKSTVTFALRKQSMSRYRPFVATWRAADEDRVHLFRLGSNPTSSTFSTLTSSRTRAPFAADLLRTNSKLRFIDEQ